MADVFTTVATFEGTNEDLFLKPFYQDPAITDLGFDIIVGNNTRLLYFNTQLDKITKEKADCGWDYEGGAEVNKKPVTPVEFAAAVEQCYKPFMETFFAAGLPAGHRRGELSPDLDDILMQLHADVFKRDMVRKLFLSDTNLGDAFYNSIDGVYAKLAASTSPNVGALTATDFSDQNILDTMFGIYEEQDDLLRSYEDSQKRLLVTGNIYDAWKKYLQTNTGNSTVKQSDFITSGISDVRFNNIPLVPLRFVDRALKSDFTTSNVTENPYRVILTLPQVNHKLVLDKNSFGDAKAWYENKDDKYYMVGSAMMAYEYGYDELNVIGGF